MNITTSSFLSFFVLALGLSLAPAHAGIRHWNPFLATAETSPEQLWSLVAKSAQGMTKVTFADVVTQLPLLTPADTVVDDRARTGKIVIAGGYVVLTPEMVLSYRAPTDYLNGVEPEFKYYFSRPATLSRRKRWIKPQSEQGILNGMSIAVDANADADHPYHGDKMIGSWNYPRFVTELQGALVRELESRGATVIRLRPQNPLNAQSVDHLNQRPPQIVISMEFNADKQDRMVTFAGGNILNNTFANPRMRARFVHAALTGKSRNSLKLGARIARRTENKMGVQPLAWENAYFRGRDGQANVAPVAATHPDVSRLHSHGGYSDGVGMRDLKHNGIFAAGGVVIPFPDMQWVMSQVAARTESRRELNWIELYTTTLADAITEHWVDAI